jgi:hypothetical protein
VRKRGISFSSLPKDHLKEIEKKESELTGRMTISTNNRRSGQSEPLFRSDDVYNPLSSIPHPEIGQAKLFHIVFEGSDLGPRVGFFDKGVDRFERFSGDGAGGPKEVQVDLGDFGAGGEARLMKKGKEAGRNGRDQSCGEGRR